MSNEWSGRRVQAARAVVATWLPAPCGQCGEEVMPGDQWVVGHKIARSQRPDLMWSISNWRPEHKPCSDASGQAVALSNAVMRANGSGPVLPSPGALGSPRLFPNTHRKPIKLRSELEWAHHAQNAPTWLQPFLAVPGDASVPLAMSPKHPDAVGSYGWDAIVWVQDELGIELRWWQQLAFVRQLEYRMDGSLCWRTILESCPRRAGKSVRLRSMALWRLANHELFGETQLALHTGKDVAIVREIHRQAWRWAEEREDWNVRKGVGQEEVRFEEVHRWLVRSTESVYGYDVTLGMVDEAWAVEPPTYEEGLEPATLERSSPQLLLTSTAHRRSTSLMRKKLTAALAGEDGETLLLLWGALPQDDPSDPATWQKASPHWTPDRAKMIGAKYAAAFNGQADPELDDPDPMAGFTAQYINLWRLDEIKQTTGDALTSQDTWDDLAQKIPDRRADAVAIESGFNGGISVAYAWKEGVVHAEDYLDLATAAAVLKAEGLMSVLVGASMIDDPALAGFRVTKASGRSQVAVQDLERSLKDNTLRHSGEDHLTAQVLAVRTQPSTDGVRVVSRGRTDALKAVAWAHSAARKPSKGRVRVLVPTGG